MISGLSLIGAGMDSCVVNTQNLVTSQNYRSVETAKIVHLLTGFHVLVDNNSNLGEWGLQ